MRLFGVHVLGNSSFEALVEDAMAMAGVEICCKACGYFIVEHAVGGAVHSISSWWVGQRMAQVPSAIEGNGKHGRGIQELSHVRI